MFAVDKDYEKLLWPGLTRISHKDRKNLRRLRALLGHTRDPSVPPPPKAVGFNCWRPAGLASRGSYDLGKVVGLACGSAGGCCLLGSNESFFSACAEAPRDFVDLAKPSSGEGYHSLYHWRATDAAMKLINKDNCSNTLVLAARGAEIKLHDAFTTRPC